MHYYSYKYHEVLNLEWCKFKFLLDCMIKAKASDDLEMIDIISFPHLKDATARNKKHNQILRKAETVEELDKRVVTTDELTMNGIKVGNIADHIKE